MLIDPYRYAVAEDDAPAPYIALLTGHTGVVTEWAGGLTVTSAGGVAVSTSTPKFGTHSINVPDSDVPVDGTDHISMVDGVDLERFTFPGVFTMELWIRPVEIQGAAWTTVFNSGASGYVAGSFALEVDFEGRLRFMVGATPVASSAIVIVEDSWQHVAVSRDEDNIVRIFVDGAVVATSSTVSGDIGGLDEDGFSSFCVARGIPFLVGDFDTLVDQVRVAKVCYYDAAFTAPVNPFVATVALLHLNGTNGSTTITDEHGSTWTVTGSAAITTGQSVLGGASLDAPGATGYLTSASNVLFGYGMGDFAIEFRVRLSGLPAVGLLFDQRLTTGNLPRPALYVDSGGSLHYYVNGADRIVGGTLAINTWAAVAIARVSGTTRLFVNGAVVGTWADATDYEASPVRVGEDGVNPGGVFDAPGQYDELRISKGDGRYSAGYTVATEEFAYP